MPRYSPQFLWLLMGPVIGALSGAVVGTMVSWGMVVADPDSWSGLGMGLGFGLYLGGLYGGMCGVAVGFVAAVPLVFLIGRHLRRDVARRRAHVLGGVLPPVALLGLAMAFFDVRPSVPHGEELLVLLPLAATVFLGSRLAGWVAGLDAPPTPAPDA